MNWVNRRRILILIVTVLVSETTAIVWAQWMRERRQALSAVDQGAEIRVLAMGHSITRGEEVHHAKTFTALLERLLSSALNRKTVVANEGRPGWSTYQQLVHLPDFIGRHDPQQILLLTGLHDTYALTEGPRASTASRFLHQLALYSRLFRMLEIWLRERQKSREDLGGISAWTHEGSEVSRLSALKLIEDPGLRARVWLGFSSIPEALSANRSPDHSIRDLSEELLSSSEILQWDAALVARSRSQLRFAMGGPEASRLAIEEIDRFQKSGRPPSIFLRAWIESLKGVGVRDVRIDQWLAQALPSEFWASASQRVGPAWPKIPLQELEMVWNQEPAWGELALQLAERSPDWRDRLRILVRHRRSNPSSQQGVMILNRILMQHQSNREVIEKHFSDQLQEESSRVQEMLQWTWRRANDDLLGSQLAENLRLIQGHLLSEGRGRELILMSYPPVRTLPTRAIAQRVQRLNRILRNASDQMPGPPLRFVDLTQVILNDQQVTGRSLNDYYRHKNLPHDLHFNEVGHEVIARALAELWLGPMRTAP